VADIAVISVAVTGAVALGTPLIGGLIARWQGREVARTARYDELRSVLDDAAIALLQVWETAPTELSSPLELKEIEERLALMQAALHKVWQQQGRIAIRLGTDHPVYRSYEAAHGTAGGFLTYYTRRLSHRDTDLSLEQMVDEMPTAIGRFTRSAAELVGPDRKL
jgi:hypothetical protein